MSEAFGVILRFLGTVLSAIYDVVPSYALAIVLLTILVRVVLIPLTVKQIRSMTAMQRLQPELKRLQQKYKGDRQKMNEELMKLYREHGVNPLGGCFPLLMQAPVFIALYAVLRGSVFFSASVEPPTPAQFTFDKTVLCRPEGAPSASGEGKDTLVCTKASESQTFDVASAVQLKLASAPQLDALPPYASVCLGRDIDTAADPDLVRGFQCQTPGGTGHIPKEEALFRDIVLDKSTFLGMHLACSPTQATSDTSIRECTASGAKAGGASVIGYYGLVLLMVGTTFFQQRQMSAQATGPQAKQMQMMTRIMPIFLGFISLSIPAGVLIYWVVSNVWTIGQQQIFLKKQIQSAPPPESPKGKQAKPKPKQ